MVVFPTLSTRERKNGDTLGTNSTEIFANLWLTNSRFKRYIKYSFLSKEFFKALKDMQKALNNTFYSICFPFFVTSSSFLQGFLGKKNGEYNSQNLVSDNLWYSYYYMAVSHKDWELPNSRIWLAEIDIESGLAFPI